MSRFGGGGVKCTICDKTAYPAETIMFEKKPYHVACFKCSECNKKMEGAGKAAQYDEKIYCHQCFQKGGFAQKQRNVKWTKKESTGTSSGKFGGGGNPCTICQKTVYPAETVQYEKKPYHQDCFKCSKESCGKKLNPSSAAQYEGVLFCTKCFREDGYNQKQAATKSTGTKSTNALASKFGGGGTKCEICTKTVYAAETVSFEKRAYHAACFTCQVCDKKMTPSGANKFDEDDKRTLLCGKCFNEGGYRQKQAKQKSTKGSSTGAASSRFSKFGGGGTKCIVCTKTVYAAEMIQFEKQPYHAECFTCKNCSKKLTPASCSGKKLEDGSWDTYCKKCFQELGLHRANVN